MTTLAGPIPAAKPPRRAALQVPRILTAVPICDGHDSPIITINLELVRHGIEVIYLGYHRSVRDVVRAAIQEDVVAIGLSSYNGGHLEFFTDVLKQLKRLGAGDIRLFGGGGGTITPADAALLKRRGTDEIFFAGTPLNEIIHFVQARYGQTRVATFKKPATHDDRNLAKWLSAAQYPTGRSRPRFPPARLRSRKLPRLSDSVSSAATKVIGLTGPGGAGKTTLIDELVLRFLQARPKGRLAILSHDPSLTAHGALLGDRAAMVYAQNDRVFMRSLATHGHAGGLSQATARSVELLKHAGFDLVLIESAGIGQEDAPFAPGLVHKQVLVMSPDYGSRLQLQKIVMLELADIVVVNKTDLPAARTAVSELEQRLALNRPGPRLISTIAKRHRDPGVDALWQELIL